MKDVIWDGITKSETLYPDTVAEQTQLFDLAKQAEWDQVIERLSQVESYLVGDIMHSIEPDDMSFNSLIHYAALTNADPITVERLIELGASRYQRNAKGLTALDIAKGQNHELLYALLEPKPKLSASESAMAQLEKNFHALIMQRADSLVQKHLLRLPQLDMILECEGLTGYFPVVGMYGGFRVFLKADPLLMLTSRSECRVVGGSGQTHDITVDGIQLVEDGW